MQGFEMHQMMEGMAGLGPLAWTTFKALLVLIAGWTVAGLVSQAVRRRVAATPRIDPTLGRFAASVVKWVLLIVVLIAVLGIFGIQATSLVAILGAGTLAVGLALQGTLADLAAGVMLILFRPYRVGQYVDIGGTAGTVESIDLFVTELTTPDNIQIIMPNGRAWGAVVTNYSAHDTRRLDLTFGIDYGDDAGTAMGIVQRLAEADDRVMDDPAPWVRVTNLGTSSVDLGARLWCRADDYLDLKVDMLKRVKEAFDDGGITIPYPHSVEIRKSD